MIYPKLLILALITLSFINLSIDRVYANGEKIKEILKRLDGAKESCNECKTNEQRRLLNEANTKWQELSDNEKKDLIQELLKKQLKSGSPKPEIVVVWDESKKVEGARVTGGENGTVKITLGNDLKEGSIAGLAPFLCYEAEVARIRAQIQQHCTEENNKRMKKEVIKYLAEAYKKATGKDLKEGADIFEAIDQIPKGEKERVYINAYEALMDHFKHKKDDYKYYASWMFEKIVTEKGKGDDKSCDLKLGVDYNWDADVNKVFKHDIDAKQKARENCDCPKYKLKIKIFTEGSCPNWGYPGTVFIRVGRDGFLVPVDDDYHEYYIDNSPFLYSYITNSDEKGNPPKDERGNPITPQWWVELVHSEGMKKLCEEKTCPKTEKNCRFSIHYMKWVPTIKHNKNVGTSRDSMGEGKQKGNSVIFKEEDLLREDSSQKIFILKADFYLKCDCPKPVKFKIKIIPPIGGPSEKPRDD